MVDGGRQAPLLGALDEMVEQDPETPCRPRPEAPHGGFEPVGAVEALDDDTLGPQVVAPDLLHELGVVDALDPDATGAGGAGRETLDGDRTRRGAAHGPVGGVGSGDAQGDGPTVDEDAAVDVAELVVAAPVVTHDEQGWPELDDGPDDAGAPVLDDEAGAGVDHGPGAAPVAGGVDVEGAGEESVVTHGDRR